MKEKKKMKEKGKEFWSAESAKNYILDHGGKIQEKRICACGCGISVWGAVDFLVKVYDYSIAYF